MSGPGNVHPFRRGEAVLTDEQFAAIRADVQAAGRPPTSGWDVVGYLLGAWLIICLGVGLLWFTITTTYNPPLAGTTLSLGTEQCPVPHGGQALLIVVGEIDGALNTACRLVQGRAPL